MCGCGCAIGWGVECLLEQPPGGERHDGLRLHASRAPCHHRRNRTYVAIPVVVGAVVVFALVVITDVALGIPLARLRCRAGQALDANEEGALAHATNPVGVQVDRSHTSTERKLVQRGRLVRSDVIKALGPAVPRCAERASDTVGAHTCACVHVVGSSAHSCRAGTTSLAGGVHATAKPTHLQKVLPLQRDTVWRSPFSLRARWCSGRGVDVGCVSPCRRRRDARGHARDEQRRLCQGHNARIIIRAMPCMRRHDRSGQPCDGGPTSRLSVPHVTHTHLAVGRKKNVDSQAAWHMSRRWGWRIHVYYFHTPVILRNARKMTDPVPWRLLRRQAAPPAPTLPNSAGISWPLLGRSCQQRKFLANITGSLRLFLTAHGLFTLLGVRPASRGLSHVGDAGLETGPGHDPG